MNIRQTRLLKSRRQEKQGMERFGGTQNPRSGARWDRKNDGRTADELVEFKRTDNRHSITLLYSDLIGLYRHAVAESRSGILCFELGGKHWVVLPESDYHELAGRRSEAGPASDLRTGLPQVARSGKVRRPVRHWANESVLRRSPAQRSGAGGQVGVPGDAPRSPRSVPGPRPVSRLRPGERGEVGGLGRVFRARAASDQASEAP